MESTLSDNQLDFEIAKETVLAEDRFDSIDAKLDFEILYACLSEEERRLVHMRFFKGLKQREIAVFYNVSKSRIGQRLKRILDKLHNKLTKPGKPYQKQAPIHQTEYLNALDEKINEENRLAREIRKLEYPLFRQRQVVELLEQKRLRKERAALNKIAREAAIAERKRLREERVALDKIVIATFLAKRKKLREEQAALNKIAREEKFAATAERKRLREEQAALNKAARLAKVQSRPFKYVDPPKQSRSSKQPKISKKQLEAQLNQLIELTKKSQEHRSQQSAQDAFLKRLNESSFESRHGYKWRPS